MASTWDLHKFGITGMFKVRVLEDKNGNETLADLVIHGFP